MTSIQYVLFYPISIRKLPQILHNQISIQILYRIHMESTRILLHRKYIDSIWNPYGNFPYGFHIAKFHMDSIQNLYGIHKDTAIWFPYGKKLPVYLRLSASSLSFVWSVVSNSRIFFRTSSSSGQVMRTCSGVCSSLPHSQIAVSRMPSLHRCF